MKQNPHITGWNPDSPCRLGHTDGRYHDCGYVESVNRLLPEAERLAEQRLRDHIADYGRVNKIDRADLYARFLIEESQSLCEVEGLRRAGPR